MGKMSSGQTKEVSQIFNPERALRRALKDLPGAVVCVEDVQVRFGKHEKDNSLFKPLGKQRLFRWFSDTWIPPAPYSPVSMPFWMTAGAVRHGGNLPRGCD